MPVLTLLPKITGLFEDIDDNVRAVHKAMVGTLDDLHGATIRAHVRLHPADRILSDALVPIPVPHSDFVRITSIREAPWLLLMIQDLEQVGVSAFR